MIRKSIIKIVSLLLIIGLNWAGFSAVIETFAYFNDTETSTSNTFTAGTLDFSLSADDWTPEEKAINLQPGESVTRNISVIKNGSLSFQYNAKTIIDTENSNTGFCNALNLEAKLEGNTKYNGSLSGFNFAPVVIGNDGKDDWVFTITLSSSYTPPEGGAGCAFKFVFDGWQEGFSFGQGFSDSEELDNALETGGSTVSGYSPIADAYVSQKNNEDDKNFGNSKELQITTEKNKNKRTFIKFEFHFPSGTTILSSALKLFMKSAPSVSRTYEAWRVTGAWTENGITWNNQPSVATTPTDSISSGTTKNVWLSWNVTSDVQDFVAGTYQNHGWQLKDSDEDSSTAYEAKFYSRNEDKQLAFRPMLEVQFSAPEITTDHLVINEVYYHVGTGKGKSPDNEWVEIYNPTDSPVDISGWQICDNNDCDTIPSSAPIPAKGFAVITYKSTTWNYWSIPPEAVKIVLNFAIGNGLADNGDRVELRKSDDSLVDAMSYGNDKTYFELPLSGKGKSLARIIKGYDTDSATDWIINATPNPGTNPSVDGVETLIFTPDGVAVAGWEPVFEEDTDFEEEIFEDEPVVEETPVVDEETVVEEQKKADEQPVIENAPANTEQEIILPDNNSSEQPAPGIDNDGGGVDNDNGDSTANSDSSGDFGEVNISE